ncbi:MAG: helix-turn-helix transcriptional regulator, partial [Clostridium sp.]|nr:helix-turn-helix transcriptional regulator [Clostridium sp.]
IGKDRYIKLTASDANAIQKAYEILTKEAFNPPTISALSKMVFLNEQKLKAGFSAKYHMSISEYTTSIKMATAENLLSTTELSIEEISNILGYNYSGNFIKMFKKVHGKTPLAFRKKSK